MKKIIASIALLYVASALHAECGNLLTISKDQFAQKLKNHINHNIQPAELSFEANYMDQQLIESANFSKCMELRILNENTPQSLKRRNAILSLYGNGMDMFNTHPRLNKSEQELLSRAIQENIFYFKSLSKSSFFAKEKEPLLFFGIDHSLNGQYYIEEIRQNGTNLVKYSDLFSLNQIRDILQSNRISIEMKKYLSKVTDLEVTPRQKSSIQKPIAISQKVSSEVTYDWNGLYRVDKLSRFTYMHNKDGKKVELLKGTLVEVINRKGQVLSLKICNQEDRGVFTIQKATLDKRASKILAN